jgi:hypothetical protein
VEETADKNMTMNGNELGFRKLDQESEHFTKNLTKKRMIL